MKQEQHCELHRFSCRTCCSARVPVRLADVGPVAEVDLLGVLRPLEKTLKIIHSSWFETAQLRRPVHEQQPGVAPLRDGDADVRGEDLQSLSPRTSGWCCV